MKELITYPLNDVDYSAEDAGLFHCTRKSGVWYEDSFPIEVSGADNTIFIGKGLAWFSNTEFWGKVAAQKTKVSLDLEYADPAYDRIDVIALQFDANKNATNLIVKKGEAKTNPTIPSISRTEAVYELYLYAITRPAASLTVTSENVRDLRLDDAYCGLMADSVTSLDFPVVPVEKGGTGATTVAAARNKLGLGNTSGALPVSNGGTDAATPEEALANLGGVSITKLWENPNPKTEFPDQYISLGSDKTFNFLDIVYIENTSNRLAYTRRMSLSELIKDVEGKNGTVLSTTKEGTTRTRNVSVSMTGSPAISLHFLSGYIKTLTISNNALTSTSTENNNTCVPVAVYGIKGVQ